MNIEPAVASDSEAIAGILVASIRDLCAADHHGKEQAIARWTANKTPETVRTWIAEPGTTILVGRQDGSPVAVGGYRGDTILLNYVSPCLRFSGCSTAMLGVMEDQIAASGVAVAKLTSTETAHRFYLARGWHDTGEVERAFGMSGILMEKRLGADS